MAQASSHGAHSEAPKSCRIVKDNVMIDNALPIGSSPAMINESLISQQMNRLHLIWIFPEK